MNKKILLIIAVLASAALSARAQNIVQNPGFETGSFPPWTISGDTSFTGVNGDMPHSGSFSEESGPATSDGFTDQVLPTLAGQGYNVSFWLRILTVRMRIVLGLLLVALLLYRRRLWGPFRIRNLVLQM